MSTPNSGLPPSLLVSEIDAARLDALIENPTWRGHPAAVALQEELLRAQVLPVAQMPADVVRMHSRVECVDADGTRRTLTLVYPHEADSASGRVSVLAPVGSALLGLSQGDEMEWPKPGGGAVKVLIEEVTYQPERAGELHR